MKITNINYKGYLSPDEMKRIKFHIEPYTPSPHQVIVPVKSLNAKLLIFPSGKCRLMGLKRVLTENEVVSDLPVKINSLQIQSASAVIKLDRTINLFLLAKNLSPKRCVYEPELFPALRLTGFNPLCVNVFSTGKIVILGLKDLTNQHRLAEDIIRYINTTSN